MTHLAILYGLIFLFGICIGSFANVCIHRIPKRTSIVFPGSRCPWCETAIRLYDNIPIVSFLLLKGRCRACGKTISPRYPLIELICGGFSISLFLKYGLTLEWLVSYTFIITLMVITFIDIDHQIIPDIITLPGVAFFFAVSLVLHHLSWIDSAVGALLGGGVLLLIAAGYHFFAKKEGMGGGDIKLLAMVGAFIGWKGVLFTLFLASVVGTLVGFILMRRTDSGLQLAIPFGPFLSIGAISYVHFGNRIIGWYLG